MARYLKTNNKYFRNVALVTAALLPLAKVPWVVAPISLIFILAFHRKWRDVFLTIIITFLFFSLFLIYGLYFDKELFLNLWRLQLARYDISFAGFLSFFTSPLLVDRYYLDGWIYFGFISLFLLANEFKKHLFIIFPFLAYFLIYLSVIPNEPGHGWYRYPFYPFLIISTCLFIKEYFSKNQILTFLFLVFIGLPLFELTWLPTFGFSYVVFRIVIVGFGLSLLPIFIKGKKIITLATISNYLWLGLFFLLNIWAVMIYNEQ